MPSNDADLSCPYGGSFYACTEGSLFLGCCKSDPCGSNGCNSHDLTAASFNATYGRDLPDQKCSGGAFYTCRDIDVPFLGCCKNNPCQSNGCSAEYLTPAKLSDADAAVNFPTSTSSASSAVSTSKSSTRTATASAHPSTSATNTPTAEGHGLSRGAIAGIGVGGFILLLAIAAIVVAICTKKHRKHPPVEKHSFTIARESVGTDIYRDASQGQAELAAPMLDPRENGRAPSRTPNSTMPLNPSAVSSPSTALDANSPAISSLSPNSNTSTGRWSGATSQVSELAGSDAVINNRRSELYGSSTIHVGYQPRSSLLSAPSNPYNNPSTYTGQGYQYQAYRPG